jgi:hypothetical protein
MQATCFRFLTPMLLGLCLVGLAVCAPYATPTRTKGQIPPVAPGRAAATPGLPGAAARGWLSGMEDGRPAG